MLVVNRWNGQEVVVAKTRGWAPKAGAYLQWGVSDSQLFYNDVVHGMRICFEMRDVLILSNILSNRGYLHCFHFDLSEQ